MTIEEKKAAVKMYMKTLLKSSKMALELLEEGHHEAAKMLQSQFCDQFEEAFDGMNSVFYPDDEDELPKTIAPVEVKKRKVTV